MTPFFNGNAYFQIEVCHMKWKKMSIPSRKKTPKSALWPRFAPLRPPIYAPKKIDRVMSTCRSLLLKLKFLGQFTLRPEILLRVTQKRIQEVQQAFKRPTMTLKPPRTTAKLTPGGPYLVNQSHYWALLSCKIWASGAKPSSTGIPKSAKNTPFWQKNA